MSQTLRRAWNDPGGRGRGLRRDRDADELYLFAVGDGEDVTARYFGTSSRSSRIRRPARRRDRSARTCPGYGVAGMPGRVLIRQGEQVGRPSELPLEVEPPAG